MPQDGALQRGHLKRPVCSVVTGINGNAFRSGAIAVYDGQFGFGLLRAQKEGPLNCHLPNVGGAIKKVVKKKARKPSAPSANAKAKELKRTARHWPRLVP